MEIINKLSTLAIWIIYSIYEGKREAYYYQVISLFGLKRPNLHWIYALQRGLFLIVIGLLLWSITIPIALAFIFPFFHDGSYYMKYNDLYPDTYKKRFFDQSTSSNAIMEFNWMSRCFGLFIGVSLMILNILICELFGL